MTLRLTEDQRRKIRKLIGRDLGELKLVLMAGPEPVLLAWAWPQQKIVAATAPQE